jgi:hypothetical protein
MNRDWVDKISQQMGDEEAFEDHERGWPAGCTKKMLGLSREYEVRLRAEMLRFAPHEQVLTHDLRHKILPTLVRDIFKDWSPLKQEYLVKAGSEIWFDTDVEPMDAGMRESEASRRAWEGFHEQCTKWVQKQGFPSGKGDRELFGWTIEEGDKRSQPDSRVIWSDDEGEESDNGSSKDKSEEEEEKVKVKNKGTGKGKGRTMGPGKTAKRSSAVVAKARNTAPPSKKRKASSSTGCVGFPAFAEVVLKIWVMQRQCTYDSKHGCGSHSDSKHVGSKKQFKVKAICCPGVTNYWRDSEKQNLAFLGTTSDAALLSLFKAPTSV